MKLVWVNSLFTKNFLHEESWNAPIRSFGSTGLVWLSLSYFWTDIYINRVALIFMYVRSCLPPVLYLQSFVCVTTLAGQLLPALLLASVQLGAMSGLVTAAVIKRLDNIVKIYSQSLTGNSWTHPLHFLIGKDVRILCSLVFLSMLSCFAVCIIQTMMCFPPYRCIECSYQLCAFSTEVFTRLEVFPLSHSCSYCHWYVHQPSISTLCLTPYMYKRRQSLSIFGNIKLLWI